MMCNFYLHSRLAFVGLKCLLVLKKTHLLKMVCDITVLKEKLEKNSNSIKDKKKNLLCH